MLKGWREVSKSPDICNLDSPHHPGDHFEHHTMAAPVRIVWELVAIFGLVTLFLLHLYSRLGRTDTTSLHVVVKDKDQQVVTALTQPKQLHQSLAKVISSTSATPSIVIQHQPDPTGPEVQKLPPPRKVEKSRIAESLPSLESADWDTFTVMPNYHDQFSKDKQSFMWKFQDTSPIVCPKKMVHNLAQPRLQEKDLEFCKWALSPTGGRVVVGKSWGNVKSKEQKERFDTLNCNAVNKGANPSCADSWGDESIRAWRANNASLKVMTCDSRHSSRVTCNKNSNNDLSCSIMNAMIDFSKVCCSHDCLHIIMSS